MTALRRFWVLALVVGEGAGALSRQSLGTAIFGGLLASTFLSLFIVPVLYVMIGTARDRLQRLGKNDGTWSLVRRVKIPLKAVEFTASELSCGLIVTILNLLLVPVL